MSKSRAEHCDYIDPASLEEVERFLPCVGLSLSRINTDLNAHDILFAICNKQQVMIQELQDRIALIEEGQK